MFDMGDECSVSAEVSQSPIQISDRGLTDCRQIRKDGLWCCCGCCASREKEVFELKLDSEGSATVTSARQRRSGLGPLGPLG
jgi:hypothetical protein